MSTDHNPAKAGDAAMPRPFQIGDVVRVLPAVKVAHEAEETVYPGVTSEMVDMIGRVYPISATEMNRGHFLVDLEEWLFLPEWVELVRPITPQAPAPASHPSTIEAAAMLAKVIAGASEGNSTAPAKIPLSDDLKYWRAEGPDEWIMDRFIKKSEVLEASHAALLSAVTRSQAALAKWNRPDSDMGDLECLLELLKILDDQSLVQVVEAAQKGSAA